VWDKTLLSEQVQQWGVYWALRLDLQWELQMGVWMVLLSAAGKDWWKVVHWAVLMVEH
jgi:hypothetical protein